MTNGYLDEVEVERVKEFEEKYVQHLKLRNKKLMSELAEKKVLEEGMIKGLEKTTKEFVNSFKKTLKK